MLRYWNGAAWTDHRMPSMKTPDTGAPSQPPTPPPPSGGVTAAPPAKPGMPFAWALACTPIIWLLLDVVILQFGGSFDSPLSTLAALAVNTVLVVLDSRALSKAGVRLSPWWGILLLPVYLVLRTKRAHSTIAVPLLWLALVVGYGAATYPVLNPVNEASASPSSRTTNNVGLDSWSDPLAGYTCQDLSAEAVRISAEDNNALVTLLKVRIPRLVEDNISTYALPTGGGETLVLACAGTGVWSDGTSTKVRMKLTVDADGDSWVFYRPVS
jgi:hypothetical protein